MTDGAPPIPDSGGPGIQGGRGPAPEIVGAALAVVVLAVVGTSVLAGAGRPAIAEPSPSPIASQVVAVPSVAPPVDPIAVELLSSLNQSLAVLGASMEKEVARATLRTADVRLLIQQVNSKAAVGSDVVSHLGGFLGGDQPGGQLAQLYASMGATATDTLGASLRNQPAYRVGASALIKLIDKLPAMQQAIEDLLTVPASAPPSPSASPPPSNSPPPATPTPPPATPIPTESTPSSDSPSPSASTVLGAEQLTNGDFEAGVDAPWALLVSPDSAATLSADTTAPASGKTSARVDIAVGNAAFGGITLQQGGLHIEAGGLYTVSLSTRAADVREIRVRVTSTAGDTYLTRVTTIGNTWVNLAFTFNASVTDPDAVVEIDAGRWDQTVWIDSVSFRRAFSGS